MRKVIIVAVILVVALLVWVSWDFFRIDRCLDRGGRWNYAKSECEGERSLGLDFVERLEMS